MRLRLSTERAKTVRREMRWWALALGAPAALGTLIGAAYGVVALAFKEFGAREQ